MSHPCSLQALLDQGQHHFHDELTRIGRHLGDLDQATITLKLDLQNVGQEAQRQLAEHALLHDRIKADVTTLVSELDEAKQDSNSRDVVLTEGLTKLRADFEDRANTDLAKLTAHYGALSNDFTHLKGDVDTSLTELRSDVESSVASAKSELLMDIGLLKEQQNKDHVQVNLFNYTFKPGFMLLHFS